MPYMIVSKDGKHCVCKQNSDGSPGEELHCYDNKSEAEAYMKAKYAHMHDNRNKSTFQNIRYQVLNGEKYIIAPGVPVRAQVLNDYLLPADEIGKFYSAWNGSPITLRHPVQNNGSANVPEPDVPIIGKFYAASFDGSRLTGEYWLNEKMLLAYSPETHKRIISGLPVETSTGYWSDEEDAHGTFENLEYKTIHRNIRPDHIAILPDEFGACSIEQGCGVNRNAAYPCNDCPCKKTMKGNSMNLKDLLAKLSAFGMKVKVNEAQEGEEPSFEIEASPPTGDPPPVSPPTPGAPLFSETEIAALKALAAAAPVIQNAAATIANEGLVRKNALIASIKANGANPFGDDELNGMTEAALMKLNAHFNTNFAALGEVSQNEDKRIAIPPDTFNWTALQKGQGN